MLLDRILRAPEDDDGGGGETVGPSSFSSAMEGASAAAENRMAGVEVAEPVKEVVATPSEPSAEPQGAAPAAPVAPVSDGKEDYEIDGKVYRLSRAEATRYLGHALRVLREQQASEARHAQEGQQTPQPRQPGSPPQLTPETQAILDYYTKDLKAQVQELTADKTDRQKEKQIGELVDHADKAMAKHDVFKSFEGRTRERLRGWIISEKLFNDDSSWETIAKEVGEIIGSQRQAGTNEFVEKKIAAAGKRTDTSGGAPPASMPKKLDRHSITDGSLARRVVEKYG